MEVKLKETERGDRREKENMESWSMKGKKQEKEEEKKKRETVDGAEQDANSHKGHLP